MISQVDCICMLADGDENASEKKQRQLETLKKRALSSDIMRDLQKQYDDRPEEIVVCYTFFSRK